MLHSPLIGVSALATLRRLLFVAQEVRVNAEIKKWGNSLALRVTGVMAELPKFKAGTKVTVDVSSDSVCVKPAVKKREMSRFPCAESALLIRMTPEKAHADTLAPPVGTKVNRQWNDT